MATSPRDEPAGAREIAREIVSHYSGDDVRWADELEDEIAAALTDRRAAEGGPSADVCLHPHCHMRDSSERWEGSPEWQRARTSATVESAALASEAPSFTGGAENWNSEEAMRALLPRKPTAPKPAEATSGAGERLDAAPTCESRGHIYNSSGCVFCGAHRCRYGPPGTSARCTQADGHEGSHTPSYSHAAALPQAPGERVGVEAALLTRVLHALKANWPTDPHAHQPGGGHVCDAECEQEYHYACLVNDVQAAIRALADPPAGRQEGRQ